MSENLQHYLNLMEEQHTKLQEDRSTLQAEFNDIVDDLKEFIEIIVDLFPAGTTNTRAIEVKRYLATKYPLFLEKISPMYLAVIREEIQHFDKKKTQKK